MVQLGEKMQSSRGGAPKKKHKEDSTRGASPTGKGQRTRAAKRPKHELSSGLPSHWPNSTPEELALRPVRHIEVGNPQTFAYCNNFIKSSHYEFWNFVPKFLLDEFDPRFKIANVYFLGIAFLQMVPVVSVTQGVPTTLIPLSMLILIDGLFVFLEDLERHRSDAIANATLVSRYNPDKVQFEEKRWAELEVGDFVQIGTRQIVPADIILISVAEKLDIPTGKCFVETKSLDGETNLKARQALPITFHDVATVRALDRVRGTLSMEHPNRSIHSFQGVIELDSFQEGASRGPKNICEVSKDNVVLRGSVVRNCHWIIGLVVNTGRDSKIFMSTQNKVIKKHSSLEKNMQKEIVKVFLLLIGICVLGACGNWYWEDSNLAKTIWYLNYPAPKVTSLLLSAAHFLLVHAPMIPVSLYVSLAVTRYAQSYFMHHDLEMYHEIDDRRMEVKDMNLNEQLGQISHVMTDKTGTLTCNVMDFRKMSVYGVRYGKGISSIARANWELLGREIPKDILEGEERAQENAVKHVAFYCPRYEADMATHSPQRVRIQNFFRALAICHDAEIEHDLAMPDEPARLSTSNPDDEALICAADYFGFKFIERTDTSYIKIENRYSRMSNNIEEVECLHIFDWSPKRKRMSVIVKDPVTGVITLYCKGADSVIIPLLAENKDEENVVRMIGLDQDKFTEEGLRCLYISSRVIKDDFYKVWNKKYTSARVDMRQLERRKRGEANTIDELIEDVEQQLTLLGCTGIEDRLQYGVSECIEELMAAGINIWMLTGDGQDTAVNSGLAAKVVLPPQHSVHCIFDRKAFKTKLEMRNAFKLHINTFDTSLEDDGLNMMKPWFLVIDGATLAIAMEDQAAEGMRYLLTELCLRCRAVIGCRVSPSQKKELVQFLTDQKGTVVLAVGDGANDMPMIRAAHVGVGLIGQEGEQAAAAADYAISQFRYLSPLIIKHGQSNYTRTSNLICYIFYKNLLMSLGMYWFNLNNGFTGQSIFTDGAIQMYNLFYTSLPIIYYAAHDMAVSGNTFYRFPQTYRACIAGKYFNSRVFWSWMGTSFYESLVLAVVPVYILQGFDTVDGTLSTFWQSGVLSMTAMVVCVNFKILFIQNKFHWTHFALLLAGVASWIASMFLISDIISFDYNMYQLFQSLVIAPFFWVGLVLLLTMTVGRDVYSCAVERHFNFEPFHIVQEADAKQQIKLKKRGHDSGGDPDRNRMGLRKASVWSPKIAPGVQQAGVEMVERKERVEQGQEANNFVTPTKGFTAPRVIKSEEQTTLLGAVSNPDAEMTLSSV